MTKTPQRGLGWRPGRGSNPYAYPLRHLLAAARPSTRQVRQWWSQGWWGDQGATSQCTIYAWLAALADGPVIHPTCPAPLVDPTTLYQEGQAIDGTPISDVDSGLSSDAAAQVMKRRGWISAYHWGSTTFEVVQALLTVGPVVLGTDWRAQMMEPGAGGIIRYAGPSVGGHQVVLDGIDTRPGRAVIRVKQSWGRRWGVRGFAYLPIADLTKMLADGAEACVATEVPFTAVGAS